MKNSPIMDAWVQLVRAHASLLGHVEEALKAQGFPPLEWYDVLLELERCGRSMRPHELQEELLLKQYNLSRLLDRMEAVNLILRVADPTDGRGRLVSPTSKGRKLRKQMWPVYFAAVSGAVEGTLEQEQVEQLTGLLRRLRST